MTSGRLGPRQPCAVRIQEWEIFARTLKRLRCHAWPGVAAQIEFAPKSDRGAATDHRLAQEWLGKIARDGEELESLWDRVEGRAIRMVKDETAAIHSVAHDLVRFETLGGDEVGILVDITRGEDSLESLERLRCSTGRHECETRDALSVSEPASTAVRW